VTVHGRRLLPPDAHGTVSVTAHEQAATDWGTMRHNGMVQARLVAYNDANKILVSLLPDCHSAYNFDQGQ